MSTHNSDDWIERFSMGRLQEPELTQFEHLLHCDECQDAVRRMDLFLDAFRFAAERMQQHESSGLHAPQIRPNVLRFQTHLPQYSLEAAAGKFGRQMAVEPEGWVEVYTDIPLTEDMFVIHINGHSMEPDIPDGSLCVFRCNMVGPWDGKVLLVEQYGESGGSRYAVKLCRISKEVDVNREGDEAWLHQRVTMESSNPDYESWDVASAEKIRALGEFVFTI